jgi:two-component system CheB/CheR fusion protein
MALLGGALQLLAPSLPRGQRLPIDYFLRSLAVDQRENAIAIVLSGTGSDGSLGVSAIKAEGGMVMVQTPESAEFDGMPRNAIATGDVDYQLKPAEMLDRLITYAKHAFRTLRLPAAGQVESMLDSELNKIFVLLRAQP